MSRLHSTFVALVLGAAASAGLFAGVHTVRLGQKTSPAASTNSAQQIASRQAKLARWSQSLRDARAKHPPALPKIPKFAPVPAASAAPAAAQAAAAPPVRYVRPRAVVKYRHASKSPQTTTATQWSDDGSGSDPSDDGTGAGDGGTDP
jgi:hypothetical protein